MYKTLGTIAWQYVSTSVQIIWQASQLWQCSESCQKVRKGVGKYRLLAYFQVSAEHLQMSSSDVRKLARWEELNNCKFSRNKHNN